ncbi:uncharacterized protein MONBRDRAFT_36308 [Monosiga brevicollis MX1]|uniref:Uncharacterized protein n=1 Tax=Monosiga brevicollis TaxID=81824 RepID=A9UUT2_MONBE|nr:uncharacterized protein MONBRDRAFT_36308 [Monosiga brevicollis MX1]EDQ90960.1 predicted protein [Monosiga brevicollis MX1]|eukprot:XP_001744257.1 hypothetical protein [Monosiga brevicollis MX1]
MAVASRTRWSTRWIWVALMLYGVLASAAGLAVGKIEPTGAAVAASSNVSTSTTATVTISTVEPNTTTTVATTTTTGHENGTTATSTGQTTTSEATTTTSEATTTTTAHNNVTTTSPNVTTTTPDVTTTTTVAPTPKPDPARRQAYVHIFPSRDCSIGVGLDQAAIVASVAETNTSCRLSATGHYYQLALDPAHQRLVIARFYCVDHHCNNCDLDESNVNYKTCIPISTGEQLSFLFTNSSQICASPATNQTQSDLSSVFAVNFPTSNTCSSASNSNITNLGSPDDTCRKSSDGSAYQLSYIGTAGTYVLKRHCQLVGGACQNCTEHITGTASSCEHPPQGGTLQFVPHSQVPECVPASNKHSSKRYAGAVAGGVMGGLFVVLLGFFAYLRYGSSHKRSGYDTVQ